MLGDIEVSQCEKGISIAPTMFDCGNQQHSSNIQLKFYPKHN